MCLNVDFCAVFFKKKKGCRRDSSNQLSKRFLISRFEPLLGQKILVFQGVRVDDLRGPFQIYNSRSKWDRID